MGLETCLLQSGCYYWAELWEDISGRVGEFVRERKKIRTLSIGRSEVTRKESRSEEGQRTQLVEIPRRAGRPRAIGVEGVQIETRDLLRRHKAWPSTKVMFWAW